MNITAFLNYLNKTRGWAIDADYYGHIETWRQWWQGSVPKVHTRAAEYANGTKKRPIASLRMPKRVCEDWANLLLNDRTTFQIKDAATARYLLGDDEQQVGGLLRELHFWRNANALVEQAYWSGTGAFVLSAENLTVVKGKAVPGPDTRLKLDYDPASCILPLRVERGIVTEAAFVSECMMEGKPAVYLQTHTGNETRRTIRNEWFRVTDGVLGAPVFEAQAPPGTAESITVEGSPPWFALFSPAAVKNLDGGTGLGMSIFAEALAEAQGIDLAFDNYREDIRLGHKKIFYSADICRKVVDQEGVEHSIPPDDDVQSQFVTLPQKEGSLDQSSEYHEYNPDLRVEQGCAGYAEPVQLQVRPGLSSVQLRAGQCHHGHRVQRQPSGSGGQRQQESDPHRGCAGGHRAGHPVGGKEPAGSGGGPRNAHLCGLGRQLCHRCRDPDEPDAGRCPERPFAPVQVSVCPVRGQ